MAKKLKHGQHDPIHNWLDMAFRIIGGDKKAYQEWKKDRAEEIAWNSVHYYKESNEPSTSPSNNHISGFPPQQIPALRNLKNGRGGPQGFLPQRGSRISASMHGGSPGSYHGFRGASPPFPGHGVQSQGQFPQHSQSVPNIPQAGRQSYAASQKSWGFSQQPDPYTGRNSPPRRSSHSSSRRSQSFGQQQPPFGGANPSSHALSQRSLSMGQRPGPNPRGRTSHSSSQRSISSAQHQLPLGGANHRSGRSSHSSTRQSVPVNQYQGYQQGSTTKAPSASKGSTPSVLGNVAEQRGPTMVRPTMVRSRGLPTEQAEVGDMTRSFVQGMI